MPTRNVVLTDTQARLIQNLVDSGQYQNASEVIREGLRLIQRREAEDAAKLEALRTAAEAGIAALEGGAYKEFADAGSLESYLKEVANSIVNTRPRRRR